MEAEEAAPFAWQSGLLEGSPARSTLPCPSGTFCCPALQEPLVGGGQARAPSLGSGGEWRQGLAWRPSFPSPWTPEPAISLGVGGPGQGEAAGTGASPLPPRVASWLGREAPGEGVGQAWELGGRKGEQGAHLRWERRGARGGGKTQQRDARTGVQRPEGRFGMCSQSPTEHMQMRPVCM